MHLFNVKYLDQDASISHNTNAYCSHSASTYWLGFHINTGTRSLAKTPQNREHSSRTTLLPSILDQVTPGARSGLHININKGIFLEI